jgi:two-component system nitrogen regulation sensor histidine kinase GlnL
MNAETRFPAELSQRVLDNLSTSVVLFDADLRVSYVNPSAEMLFALSARHLRGQRAQDVIACTGGKALSNLKRAMRSGHPFTEREKILALPDGREITVDCTIIPLSDPQGGTALLVELQQVDRQLRISREENLFVQHQAARALIRGLAHEIKNPLGGLRGAAQLLEHDLPDPALAEYTRIIIDEADRLQALVDRLLGPNRVPNYAMINIHQVLERVYVLASAEVRGRVHIQRDYDPSIPDLCADQDQLIQALLNIVRNAVRAVSAEGGRVVLRSRVLRQFTIGNHCHRLVAQVDIEDDGPGVSEDLKGRIFYPMVSSSQGGQGIGLSIAQSLISQHGGLIECRSRPGQTVFTVFLPVENPNA